MQLAFDAVDTVARKRQPTCLQQFLQRAALAFQADVTRVFTLLLGREQTNRPYPFIGVPEEEWFTDEMVMIDRGLPAGASSMRLATS